MKSPPARTLEHPPDTNPPNNQTNVARHRIAEVLGFDRTTILTLDAILECKGPAKTAL